MSRRACSCGNGKVALITIGVTRPDGTTVSRHWEVAECAAEELADYLGDPDSETMTKPGVRDAAREWMDQHGFTIVHGQ